MDAPEDISSPKVQFKLWRRFWVGLAICVLVTPVLLWVAIDQGGKREWKRVQAELRAKGEATTIAELDLPQSGDIRDEENFGAVKWLRAKDNGDSSNEIDDVAERLKLFSHYISDKEARENYNWSLGIPFIGKPTDLALLTTALDVAASELKIELPAQDAPYQTRLADYLDSHAEIWDDLRDAKQRKHAVALPLLSERSTKAITPYHINFAALTPTRKIAGANRYRALLASQQNDPDAFVEYFQVSSRLKELSANESVSLGFAVANTHSAIMVNAFAEGLWNENFLATLDDKHFQTLQSIWQRTDFRTLYLRSQRAELALTVDAILAFPQHRKQLVQEWGGHGPPSWLLSIAPSGWFASNGAYLGDSYERFLLAPFRADASLGELLESAADWNTEMNAFNQAQELNYSLATWSTEYFEKTLQLAIGTEARRRQALIACALHRYRLQHDNAFPESLTQLTPTYLDAVPIDPVDGQSMRYAIDPSRTGFRLWSIGFDGIDDDGKLTFLAEKPHRSRINKPTYIGDWPWPTKPREFERPESE